MSEIQELHCNLVFTIDGNRPVRSMNSFIVTMILCELDRIDTIFFVKRFFCSCQKSKLFASSWCNWPFTLRYLLQISGFRIFWQVFFFQIYMFLYFTTNHRFISYHYLHPKGVFHFLLSLFATFDHKIIEIVEDLGGLQKKREIKDDEKYL